MSNPFISSTISTSVASLSSFFFSAEILPSSFVPLTWSSFHASAKMSPLAKCSSLWTFSESLYSWIDSPSSVGLSLHLVKGCSNVTTLGLISGLISSSMIFCLSPTSSPALSFFWKVSPLSSVSLSGFWFSGFLSDGSLALISGSELPPSTSPKFSVSAVMGSLACCFSSSWFPPFVCLAGFSKDSSLILIPRSKCAPFARSSSPIMSSLASASVLGFSSSPFCPREIFRLSPVVNLSSL